jgi:ADP-ribosylglycohydrolase
MGIREGEHNQMTIPNDYESRIYAGVLGKIIGVYLGRPFEGWTYERIMEELGEIQYYVHERLNKPLIVTDDDISGTFTFLRALPDHGNRVDITPAEIGSTWLNYIIENKTILWWGGMGNSTEHTAFLRLKSGIPAPESGSMETNTRVVAEQIGAQIFIDGWAMVAPGDPALATALARKAASVSHDGEAVYGAQVLAAMESLAFVENDLDRLLDTAVTFIPDDAVIYRMIAELRALHEQEPDWRKARKWLATHYGYDTYGGNVHIVPNHGLMILSLLYGNDDFQRTMMIVNTGGWDTDCNSGNVGCLMGIKNGLSGLETGPDYRGPVADRLYLPTADGGRAMTDALIETYHIVNSGRALAGLEPVAPKNGARYHFNMPGAVQGFLPDTAIEAQGTLKLENVPGHSETGARSLAFHYRDIAPGRVARAGTATFLTEEAASMPGYGLICSPTLYAGQTVRARVEADTDNGEPVACGLYLATYGTEDARTHRQGPRIELTPGETHVFEWEIGPTYGDPIAEVGIEIHAEARASGTLYLDTLTWEGEPDADLTPPGHNGTMGRRAWVEGVDHVWTRGGSLRLVQDEGTGLLIQGTRQWEDYTVHAKLSPHMIASGGIAARVQGLNRYYALLLDRDHRVCLVKSRGTRTVLAEANFPWHVDEVHELQLSVQGSRLLAKVDGETLFDLEDHQAPLTGGGIALVCEEGRMDVISVGVRANA